MSIIGIPQELKSLLTIRHPSSENLNAEVYVLSTKTGSVDLEAEVTLRQLTRDLQAEFTSQATTTLKGIMSIRHSASVTEKAIFVVRHPDTGTLSAEFRITIEGWEMQGLTAGVYRDLGVIS